MLLIVICAFAIDVWKHYLCWLAHVQSPPLFCPESSRPACLLLLWRQFSVHNAWRRAFRLAEVRSFVLTIAKCYIAARARPPLPRGLHSHRLVISAVHNRSGLAPLSGCFRDSSNAVRSCGLFSSLRCAAVEQALLSEVAVCGSSSSGASSRPESSSTTSVLDFIDASKVIGVVGTDQDYTFTPEPPPPPGTKLPVSFAKNVVLTMRQVFAGHAPVARWLWKLSSEKPFRLTAVARFEVISLALSSVRLLFAIAPIVIYKWNGRVLCCSHSMFTFLKCQLTLFNHLDVIYLIWSILFISSWCSVFLIGILRNSTVLLVHNTWFSVRVKRKWVIHVETQNLPFSVQHPFVAMIDAIYLKNFRISLFDKVTAFFYLEADNVTELHEEKISL